MSKETVLDIQIERVSARLAKIEPDSAEYYKLLSVMDQMTDLKRKQEKKRFEVTPDTIVVAGVNLAGIILILKHEQLNSISSKALSFVSKLRL